MSERGPATPIPVPPARALYGRALLRMGRGSGAGRACPEGLEAGPYRVEIKRALLARYRDHCRFADGTGPTVPLPYLFVLANGPQLALLNHPDCPYPAGGLVHRSVTFQRGPRLADAPDVVQVRVRLADRGSAARGGRDIEVHATLDADDAGGGPLGTVTSSFWVRGPRPEGAGRVAAVERPPEDRAVPLVFERRRGRRYASLSGDWNPIHLHDLTARLFGFPRAIAHGLDLLSCVVARGALADPAVIEAEFKRPVPLPSRTIARYAPSRLGANSSALDAADLGFALTDGDGVVVHLAGRMANGLRQ